MCVLVDIEDRIEENVINLEMEYDENPSNDIFVEIERRSDARVFLCDYIKEKYDETPPSKCEDELHEDEHPPYSFHEPSLCSISYLK